MFKRMLNWMKRDKATAEVARVLDQGYKTKIQKQDKKTDRRVLKRTSGCYGGRYLCESGRRLTRHGVRCMEIMGGLPMVFLTKDAFKAYSRG